MKSSIVGLIKTREGSNCFQKGLDKISVEVFEQIYLDVRSFNFFLNIIFKIIFIKILLFKMIR